MTMNTPVLRGTVSYAGGGGTAASGAGSPVAAGGTIGGGSDERGSILRVVPVALVSVHCADGAVGERCSRLRVAVVAPESHEASASAGGVADVGVGAAGLPMPAGTNAVSSPNATGAAALAALGGVAVGGVTIIESSAAASMRGAASGALGLDASGKPLVSACRALGGVAVVADVAVAGGVALVGVVAIAPVAAVVDGVAVDAGASAGA
jgi:hypothetical protein